MTWRMRSVLALALAACGDDGEGAGPPPITTGEGTTITLPTATGTDTDTDGATAGSMSSSTSMGTASSMMEGSSTCGMFTVLVGGLTDGGAGVALPIECRIKFYEEGQIDVATGEELGGFLFNVGGIVVDEYPRSFDIQSDQVPMVECGTEGYVVAACDADGDGQADDGIGGYFPYLPLAKVTIPAASIYIPIEQL